MRSLGASGTLSAVPFDTSSSWNASDPWKTTACSPPSGDMLSNRTLCIQPIPEPRALLGRFPYRPQGPISYMSQMGSGSDNRELSVNGPLGNIGTFAGGINPDAHLAWQNTEPAWNPSPYARCGPARTRLLLCCQSPPITTSVSCREFALIGMISPVPKQPRKSRTVDSAPRHNGSQTCWFRREEVINSSDEMIEPERGSRHQDDYITAPTYSTPRYLRANAGHWTRNKSTKGRASRPDRDKRWTFVMLSSQITLAPAK